MEYDYDLIIAGAGSGGLTAARFAAQLGAKVALIERHRIGGDCTWTGCVPSKALLKVAKVAHEVRSAARFGVTTGTPAVEMSRVRAYVRQATQAVYGHETPDRLRQDGIAVFLESAHFLDEHTVAAGAHSLRAAKIVLCTGARPAAPAIEGLSSVPFLTYEGIFDLDELPVRLALVGAGPIGLEMAQSFQRLGSCVTVIGERLLPREDRDAADAVEQILATEGVHFVKAKANFVSRDEASILLRAGDNEVTCDAILIAVGRRPNVEGLDLDKAGVIHGVNGIQVDDKLRTNVKHIYAAGDVTGGPQFTHFAGWQAFQAVRNALLPGSASGFTEVLPRCTFTDPEVAHVGLTEDAARAAHGAEIKVLRRNLDQVDRAVCEDDTHGFFKIITTAGGTMLGATVVAARAGEATAELAVALEHGWRIDELAGTIHAYPTYSTPIQQMAADAAMARLVHSATGRIAIGWSRLIR